MKRRLTFPNKLFLIFTFGMMATLGFLAFKNMSESAAINAAYNGFQAGNIITDYVMSDYSSMSEAQIQAFLKSKNPCNDTNTSKARYYSNHNYHIENGHFVCMADERFNGESAAHIIWQAAQDYRINPKVLIVLLEKEQGLVTDTWPNSDLQYRSATGYGCPDTAACDSKYYGFKNQIRNAAELYRYILDHGSRYYPVGNNYVKYNPDGNCGGSTVYIQNRATSALYQYTPYQPNAAVLNANPGTVVHCGAHGNSNFYYYYTKWFGDPRISVSSSYLQESDKFAIQTLGNLYLTPESNAKGARISLSKNAAEYRFERTGDYYIIRHIASSLVLDVVGGSVANGAQIQLYDFNDSCAQKWYFAVDGDKYTIKSVCSNKSLDVPDNKSNVAGIKVQMYNSNNSNAQRFIIKDLSAAPLANNIYVLKTTGGKVLDAEGGLVSNGTKLQIYNVNYDRGQIYKVSRMADGLYTIGNTTSGRVVDVSGGRKDDGTPLQLYNYNGSCAQKWIVEKSGNGYRFLSACTKKAIDVSGGLVSTPSRKLQIYTANGSNAQVWIPATTYDEVAEGNYTVTSAVNSKFAVDITNGVAAAKNGTNIQAWDKNGTAAQEWKLIKNSDNTYTFKNPKTDRVLDIAGGIARSSTNVQLYASNSTCAQKWYLKKNDDGTYRISSACGAVVLDLSGGVAKNGGNIQVWENNGTKAQKWVLTLKNSN
ncbi:RICIN domain-containing protein [Candidatus Saccharibacteria bacterium]|nr:RICIN domain-containing protein [Candidatus Saccharibacteria bacterium]